jgi:hypothetical protein
LQYGHNILPFTTKTFFGVLVFFSVVALKPRPPVFPAAPQAESASSARVAYCTAIQKRETLSPLLMVCIHERRITEE